MGRGYVNLGNRKTRSSGAAKSWPSGPVIGIGLAIGLTIGFGFVLMDDPKAAEPGPPLPALKAAIDARQAKRDALVPAGGFRSCAQAQALGFKEIYAGEKAYRPGLDADGDGKACEWNGRRLF